MQQTANLELPYILPSQAQKHVTHNEAIRSLDALVQLAVLDRDLASPPVSPLDGGRYLVAAGATGSWSGRDGKIAAWQDGAWAFLTPKAGWLVWVADEDRLIGFDGAAWIDAAVHSLNPTPLVGVNATADATDRLAVKSPASLFDAETGDHRLKVNKATAGDTASLLFQSGYSGRAEFGLAGDDDWHVKVSADGAAWIEALKVDRTTGRVTLPAALPLGGQDQVVARRHVREKLTADRIYYVRTDGSNANNGLADSPSGAFLTIQKALDVVATIDFAGFTVTVKLGDGTYAAGGTIPVTVGQAAAANLLILGNAANPGNVIVSVTNSQGIDVPSKAMCRLQAFEIRTTTTGNSVRVNGTGAFCEIHTDMRFGACAGSMILVNQGRCLATGNYAVAGNAQRRVWCKENGVYIEEFRTIAYSGTPAFSAANVDTLTGGLVSSAASTQSGAATGKRYQANANSVVSTGSGGASFYPGDVAGTTATGGQYA